MQKLVCEACGANDLVYSDGVYTCRYCGTKSVLDGRSGAGARPAAIGQGDRIENLLRRADWYWNNGQAAKAESLYRIVLEIDHGCEIARQRLGRE